MFAQGISSYCPGDFLYSHQNNTWTAEEAFEKIVGELKLRMDTMRMKDLTTNVLTATLLFYWMKIENDVLNDQEQARSSSNLKEDIDSLVQTTNQFLSTIGVVAALILSI
jgi:hypothetical protein